MSAVAVTEQSVDMGDKTVGRRRPFTTFEKIWLLTASIAAAAGIGIDMVLPAESLNAPIAMPLVGMILAVFLAEWAVVHLEYEGHAHSFSMSEFALVVGLFFAEPAVLIIGVVVGNAAVLTLNRQQPFIKIAFNVAQFALQAVLAIFVFRSYAEMGEPMGLYGWAGALLAVLAALLVSDFLINVVIRLAGSPITAREQLEAFGISALAALLNTVMALAGVVVLWLMPSAVWLAVVPPVALYMAYHAFMNQRAQQDRFRMLYEATKLLHGTPRIELALATASTSLKSMLNSEQAEIVVFDPDSDAVWLTIAGPGDKMIVMRPSDRGDVSPGAFTAVEAGRALRVGPPSSAGSIAAPLLGAEGNCIGAVVVTTRLGDVAEFDESDLATLTTFSAQVASSIANDRLIKSLAAANVLAQERESLISAKDDFLASVSHELRTPLTSVLGLSQELASPDLELDMKERSELLGLIAEQSNELANLVDDLLVSARSDIGTLYMTNEPVQLKTEVAKVLRELGRTNEVAIDGDEVRAWGDGLRLRQIIRNLISNARRYGGDEIRIEISTTETHAVLAVIDDGTGVPEELEATIFEAYGRAHEPGSQPASIGLGLHVARRLAERMGGDLDYCRNDAETRFELTLRSVDGLSVVRFDDVATAPSELTTQSA